MSSLDDIFGSSPPLHPGPERERGHRHGEGEGHADGEGEDAPLPTKEPSDLPSLRRQHVTAGYRDGISASKAEHVQRGFDAGYHVGAQLGMRAGTVLGILEGVLRGLEGRERGLAAAASGTATRTGGKLKTKDNVVAGGGILPSGNEGDDHGLVAEKSEIRQAILGMYKAAVSELDVRSVFSGMESVERTIVPGGGEKKTDAEKPELKLAEMGDTTIAKWEHRVRVPLWEENMEALETKEEDRDDVAR